MSNDRSWMYCRLQNRYLLGSFVVGVDGFLDFAFPQEGVVDEVRCPCTRCCNGRYLTREVIKVHLVSYGFMDGYTTWTSHGEPFWSHSSNFGEPSSTLGMTDDFNLRTMVIDAMGPRYFDTIPDDHQLGTEEHEPNAEAAKFFTLLEDADKPLWSGCKKYTKLSAMTQLLNCKSEYNMPAACFDRILSTVKEMLPEDNLLEPTFYKTKTTLSSLGLGVVKIDACVNDCMLYYKETENLTSCITCGHSRYTDAVSRSGHKVAHKVLRYLPLTPRLQRLYMSRQTAKHMIWHADNGFTHGEMSHPVHSEAWKHFDRTYPDFFLQPRNVPLGLCTDGFNPFNMTNKHYSCWPVISTVYNLAPGMCMKRENMFLSLVIPGPNSPGKNIDVYLRPLVDELKMLWNEGVETYDIHTRQNFQMRAALMWTISDFPGLSMLSGWSTYGPLCCPYCMDTIKSFRLQNGQKPCFFDCHRQFLPHNHPFRKQRDKFSKGRIEKDEAPIPLTGAQIRCIVDGLSKFIPGRKVRRQEIDGYGQNHNWIRRSIFWELPYWHTNLIRHNLDVMHIEKNFFENLFNTVMDIKDKTKDNTKARKDLELYCSRPELHIVEDKGRFYMPKASYSLTRDQKRVVCSWIKTLRMPDGHASNIARCVKGDSDFYGMKSHDCHIFMQKLVPIAFKEMLPKPIWEAITELSQFFRDICSTVVKVDDMRRLEKNIVVTMCKLEKIFPPGFFDSMEHLPIHLPYEARLGGPVQYRWIYPFERFLNHLKRKVKNRASVEGSIVEAYLVEETSTFCSLYFDDNVDTRISRPPRNDDGGLIDPLGRLSIFTFPGRPLNKGMTNSRMLDDDELDAASRYVLLNCDEITPFLEEFESQMRMTYPQASVAQLDHLRDKHFSKWLKQHVDSCKNEVDPRIVQLAMGPSRQVRCYNGYFINGFKFHTADYGRYKKTMNSGVCVLGSCYNDCSCDYYGIVNEILELQYFGPDNTVILFKCDWVDNDRGVRVDQQFKFVEVNFKKKLVSPDIFILGQQAQQVYFTRLPTMGREKDWWAVVKTKARHLTRVEGIISRNEECNLWVELAFQEDSTPIDLHDVHLSLELDHQPLVQTGVYPEEIDDDESSQEEEEEDGFNDPCDYVNGSGAEV